MNPHSSERVSEEESRMFEAKARRFDENLPHLVAPYSSRNWGHKMHSLCSYQGKLKPAIAHHLVREFTEPGWSVLDPLSGCGTVPLEAALQGRKTYSNDLLELGYTLSLAKVGWGDWSDAVGVRDDLMGFIEDNKSDQDITRYSEWGFNGNVPEYYHEDTYREILCARDYIQENPVDSWDRALVYSCVLHLLHGNRPYALSRRSHPVTPFKPTGEFEYRPLEKRLDEKMERVEKSMKETSHTAGVTTNLDYKDLDYSGLDAVITSPPFANSTRFYIANWMRNWMCGWEPDDYMARRDDFIGRQQKKSMDVYGDFLGKCVQWLRPGGRLIMHTGKTAKTDMAAEIIDRAPSEFKLIYHFDESVAGREKFGISDQGATTDHQYVFFERV